MSDINNILNIGLSSLQASKTSLEVTAQNIANVDTPGYSKKEVVLSQKDKAGGPPYFFNGVEVSEIKRACDEELSKQITAQKGKTGYWQTKKEYLGRVEEIFTESEQSGLNNDLNKFWNAWQKLSTNPHSYAKRQEVGSTANQLAEDIGSRSKGLQEVMADINKEMAQIMDAINQSLQKIAQINRQISEAANGQANKYKDQMDQAIEGLSHLIKVNSWQEKNGQVTVALNGHPLVEGDQAINLTTSTDDQGQTSVQKKLADGTLINVTDRIDGGQIKGLLELGNKIIPGYMNKLDNLAFNLSGKINEQHRRGYGLDGSTNTVFFKTIDSPKGAARHLALNPEIEKNFDLIAASSSADIQDNENVLKMADLQHNPMIAEGGHALSANDYYANFQQLIGSDTKDAKANNDYHEKVLSSLKDRRSMISDVSLDEQLANLIKFQQTYNASAKIVSTADQMMSTLLNLSA